MLSRYGVINLIPLCCKTLNQSSSSRRRVREVLSADLPVVAWRGMGSIPYFHFEFFNLYSMMTLTQIKQRYSFCFDYVTRIWLSNAFVEELCKIIFFIIAKRPSHPIKDKYFL